MLVENNNRGKRVASKPNAARSRCLPTSTYEGDVKSRTHTRFPELLPRKYNYSNRTITESKARQGGRVVAMFMLRHELFRFGV